MAQVTLGLFEHDLERLINGLKKYSFVAFDDHDEKDYPNLKAKVMLNGDWIGFSEDPEDTIFQMKEQRRSGNIPYEVSIVRDIVHH